MPFSSQSMPQPELRPGIEVLKAVAENMAKNLPGPSSQGDPAAEREIDEESGQSQNDEGISIVTHPCVFEFSGLVQ